MTILRAIRAVAGPEYLIATTDGLDATWALRAIRAAIGFEYLVMAADGGRR